MLGKAVRPGPLIGLALAVLATLIGCAGRECLVGRVGRWGGEQRSLEELHASVGWYDLEAQAAFASTIRTEDLLEWANKARANIKPAVPQPRKSVLVLSGGGIYGAYPA